MAAPMLRVRTEQLPALPEDCSGLPPMLPPSASLRSPRRTASGANLIQEERRQAAPPLVCHNSSGSPQPRRPPPSPTSGRRLLVTSAEDECLRIDGALSSD